MTSADDAQSSVLRPAAEARSADATLPAGPPDTFVRQVHDALEHLHDLSYLQKNPLAYEGASRMGAATPAVIQRMRAELFSAIETLSPGKNVAFRAPNARVYNLLILHYIDQLTIREAANELGISTRQADRDLRQGEQNVAVLLWEWHAAHTPEPPAFEVDISSLQDEIDRLKGSLQVVDLGELLVRVLEAIRPLADQRAVVLRLSLPPQPLILSTDPLLAEQAFLHVISRAVSQVPGGDLQVALSVAGERSSADVPALALRFASETTMPHVPVVDPVAEHLITRLGWMWEERDSPAGLWMAMLRMAAQGPIVLVIDDNQGLMSLIERYLSGEACRVIGAANGQDGLRLVQELQPAAVILDVMMPDMHGWEVLQRIRAYEPAAHLPVIICSVINNPELAQALGASAFLPKPLRKEDLLAVLGQLRVI
jgi:CheY-like chemotaxis protein